MMERWTIMSLAIILLHLGIAAAALYAIVSRRVLPELPAFRFYLGFLVACSLAGILFRSFAGPALYIKFYWSSELIHDVLLCVLALEAISVLIPKRFAFLWSVGFAVILLLTFAHSLPTAESRVLLNLAVAGDLTAGILLTAAMFFPEAVWTWELGMAVGGTVAVILSDAVSSAAWLQGRGGVLLGYATQASDLIGLTMFLVVAAAGRSMRKV